jgi:hypothetical protein
MSLLALPFLLIGQRAGRTIGQIEGQVAATQNIQQNIAEREIINQPPTDSMTGQRAVAERSNIMQQIPLNTGLIAAVVLVLILIFRR